LNFVQTFTSETASASSKQAMRRALAVSLVVTIVLPTTALSPPQASPTVGRDDTEEITIRVYDYARLEPSVLTSAEGTTAHILEQAGVKAVWIECSGNHRVDGDPECRTPLSPADLVVNLLPRSMSQRLHPRTDEFGVALEDPDGDFGFDAWIFCDLLKNTSAQFGLDQSPLLGAVMAHEIGHLLLSANSHSAVGLMRTKWSAEEFLAIQEHSLHFTSWESKKIRRAVTVRQQSARCSALNAEGAPLTPAQAFGCWPMN
jgi:hypothetical protein